MTTTWKEPLDSKIVSDLIDVIKERWPDARFAIGEMLDGEGTGVWAYTSADFLAVSEAVAEIEYNAMVKHGVLVWVIPMPAELWGE